MKKEPVQRESKERAVKAPDGTDLPVIAPNEVADFMEKLTKELAPKRSRRS